jgi:HK97 family phage major capsid protein
LQSEADALTAAERRQAALDDLARRSAGETVHTGSGDSHLDREVAKVGLLDAVRAQLGVNDAGTARAREVSRELERRSGRKAQGLLWSMNASAETRVVVSTGTGGNVIAPDYRPEMFTDRLRNAPQVRKAGATVINAGAGNITIPRRLTSVVGAWTAENAAFPVSDPTFDQITLSPKHFGVISEWSRSMALEANPDVEQLARSDMALVLAEALDAAAIAGTGTSNQPRGILNTSGIGTVALGTNGGALTTDAVADLVGQVADVNAVGSTAAFMTNSKVRRAALKLKASTNEPFGLPVVFGDLPVFYTNLVPASGTKGTGTNLSSLIYGTWSELIVAFWSEIDILVNPYESTAYSKGNIQIRAIMTCDIAVRHAASFAAITDILA